MDNLTLIGWIVAGVGGIAMWLAKTWVDAIQRQIGSLDNEIKYIKEVYFKKEEFREFKQDLWQRLDKFEQLMEARLKSVGDK
jgi:hypothetical protein